MKKNAAHRQKRRLLSLILSMIFLLTSTLPVMAAKEERAGQEPVLFEEEDLEAEPDADFAEDEPILSDSETPFVPAAIQISTADQLKKIGSDSAYPMSGDYVLTDDIDLSEENWVPLGGYIGKKGTVNPQEANVFSGTFDGQGHVISGLTINLSGSVNQTDCYGQVGLFSVIASNNSADYASVKNLIFTEVNIRTDFSDGLAAVGTLAGEVNGYAMLDNVSVINGSMVINPSASCDTVGAGGVIGECRTNDTAIGNGNISIKNIYNGVNINASGTRADLIYAGGIIGRIAKSACKEVSQCVNTGTIQYVGYDAYAISAAENSNTAYFSGMTNCYYLATGAQTLSSEAAAYSLAQLTSGTLPDGLSSSVWAAEKGCYPVPKLCLTSSAAGQIYLSGLSLEFAEGEKASGVSTEIDLPQSLGSQIISWSSSDEEILKIEDGKAIANPSVIGADTVVFLTAVSQNGYSRTFKLTILSSNKIEAVFDQNYAKVGSPLTVSVKNAGDLSFTYAWKVGGKSISNTTNSYTPTSSDLEKFITVRITATDNSIFWDLSMYVSELPVVYVNTDDGLAVTSNTQKKDATITVQGNSEFDTATYTGKTEIKGRGNSTWNEAVSWGVKKPYKLKLNKKQNLLGLGSGKNKHWVLLANMIDHTNMRNEIVHNFSKDIGMEYSMKTTDVVLILNGQYEGLYELCEHVRIGASRVDVFDWEELGEDIASAIGKANAAIDVDALETQMTEDFSWVTSKSVSFGGTTFQISDYYKDEIPEFTGGFLLDMDFRSTYDAYKYVSTFQTSNGIPMFFRAPEYAKTNSTMLSYANNYINAYEAALKSRDFTTTYQNQNVHYTDLFDLDSLVQYWWVCEFTNNWDSMKNSTYLYKNLNSMAKMGPAWDYDWAFGNINMYSMTGPFVYDNWHTTLCGISPGNGGFAEQNYQNYQWNRYLVKDPYFVTKVYEYYQKYRPTVIEEIIKDGGTIDTLEKKYQTAADANDAKWSSSYSRCSGYAFVNGEKIRTTSQKYNDAVASLKTFIQKRMEWMDPKFADVKTLYQSLGNSVSNQISVTSAEKDGKVILTATVSDNNAKYVEFVLNGTPLTGADGSKYIAVSSKKAEIEADASLLEAESTGYHTVQVLGFNSSKSYISEESNFTNFTFKSGTGQGEGGEEPEEPAAALKGTAVIGTSGNGKEAVIGETLTVTVTGSNNTGEFSYQWKRDGAEIVGATKTSYQLVKEDVGKKISVVIQSTVQTGSISVEFAKTIVEKAQEEEPQALTGTVTITSTGTKEKAEVSETLTATVTKSNNTGVLSYQWQRDGANISGAVKSTYQLVNEDVGKKIRVIVTSSVQTGQLTAEFAKEIAAENQGTGGNEQGTGGNGQGTGGNEQGTSGNGNTSGNGETLLVKQISLTFPVKTMQVYGKAKLTVQISPAGASKEVSFESSAPKIASVAADGTVTAKAAGTAVITVKAKDGSNKTAKYTIKVAKPKLKITGKTKVKKKKSIVLTAKAYGLKGTIKWKLDAKGKKLLKLNKTKGSKVKLTAKKKKGTAKLTVTCGTKKIVKKIKVTK